MKILFTHRNFLGQFKNLINELRKNPENEIIFITDDNRKEVDGVKKSIYCANETMPENNHPYLDYYTKAIIHGLATAYNATKLKEKGFVPDIIFSFSGWGNGLFLKDVFPDIPQISYYEWFYHSNSADLAYNNVILNDDQKAQVRCKNLKFLLDLTVSDCGICPTQWQKSQFPKEYQNKIKLIHDGIDTEYFKPNENVEFKVAEKNITLTKKDEVITYVARGFEPYRGFEQFMEAVEKVLKKRPNAHVLIAGDDVVCYGIKSHCSYKEQMLSKLKLDMNRVHFTGHLEYSEYLKLLQVSSCHVYLTYPFVLSWSVMEAMATACPIVASATEPVIEVMQNNKNAFLAEFFNVEHIVKRINFALDNVNEAKNIGLNARSTIIKNYDAKDMVKKQLDVINDLIKENK